MSEHVNLSKLKVADLKRLCKESGLPTTGTKPELVARLKEAFSQEDTDLDDSADTQEDLLNTEDDDLDDYEDTPVKPKQPSLDKPLPSQQPSAPPKPQPVAKVPGPSVPATAPKISKITMSDAVVVNSDTGLVKKMGLTPAERLAQRQQKFGANAEEAKKTIRAAKFGGATSVDAKKIARAQRFGLPIAGPTATTTATAKSITVKASITNGKPSVDLEKLKQRAERFGTVVSSQLTKEDEKDRLLKRKQKFGAASTGLETDEKKMKRAERFGLL